MTMDEKRYTRPDFTIWSSRQRRTRAFGREYAIPSLPEMMDISTLQQITDWAAKTVGASILIRDMEGTPITFPSMSTELCTLISGPGHTNLECRKSNAEAAAKVAETGRPQRYTCHAGLTQFAAPIQIEGQCVGTIVIGDRPMRPFTHEDVEKLAQKCGIDYEKLMAAAQKVETWSEETMNSTINLLHSITNTLFTLCYQGYSLDKRVRELTVLLEISELLTSAMGLQEVLNRITKGMVSALGFKACIIRLLDDDGVELGLKSLYNLSGEYLSKGPVILDEHPVCQAALSGEAVSILDVRTDPRFGYHEAARKEGLRSMLCVGLMSKDKPIGTVHLYTGESHNFTEDEIRLVQSIANHATAAIENAKLYEESIEKQRIEQELALAAEIQAELLPAVNPQLDGMDIAAKSISCRELSGDFYDFIELGNQEVGLAIADVCGKGAPGAILMATTRVRLRTQVENSLKTGDIIDNVNNYLCEDTRPTEFVSMFYGVLNSETADFSYTNAGHNPPIVFQNGKTFFLEEGGVPLGIIENAVYGADQIKLASGDVLLFYTDGITEAINEENSIFGVGRLIRIVQKNLNLDAQGLVDVIYEEVTKFSAGPQSDDLTIIALKVN